MFFVLSFDVHDLYIHPLKSSNIEEVHQMGFLTKEAVSGPWLCLLIGTGDSIVLCNLI